MNPVIVPKMMMDENGDPFGVTPTSFVIQFELLPAQELNGEIDEYVHINFTNPKKRQG